MLAELLGIDPMEVWAEAVEGFEKRVGPIADIMPDFDEEDFDAHVLLHDQLRHYG